MYGTSPVIGDEETMLDRSWKFHSFFNFLILLSLTGSLLTKNAHAQTDRFNGLARQIVRLVQEHFYDATRVDVWASKHADYAAHIDNLVAFAALTKRVLSEHIAHGLLYTFGAGLLRLAFDLSRGARRRAGRMGKYRRGLYIGPFCKGRLRRRTRTQGWLTSRG